MSYFSELSITIKESFHLKAKYALLYQGITYAAIAIALWLTYLLSDPTANFFGVTLSEGLKQQENGDLFAIALFTTLLILMLLIYALSFAVFGFVSYKSGWFNKSEFINIALYYRVPSHWLKE